LSTTALPVQRPSYLRPKYVLFAILALMTAIVIYKFESFLIDPAHPIWAHYEPFKWWLLPHGVAGALGLFLGASQFSDRIRQRYLNFHRIAGRIYIAGVAVCAPLGFYIQYIQGPMPFTAAAAVQAFNWILTTAIALYFVKTGNIQAHRQWMTRSFSVALVFLNVRVVLFLMGDGAAGSVDTVMTVVWVCNGFSLIAADIVLQIEEMLRRRPRPKTVSAAAS